MGEYETPQNGNTNHLNLFSVECAWFVDTLWNRKKALKNWNLFDIYNKVLKESAKILLFHELMVNWQVAN